MTAIRISRFDSLDALDAAVWNDLVAKCPDSTTFQTYEWMKSWWKTFNTDDQTLCILGAHAGDDLVGVAPLVEHRSKGAAELRILGTPHADYALFPVVGDREATLEALFSEIRGMVRGRTRAQLSEIPESSLTGQWLRREAAVPGTRIALLEGTACPRLALAARGMVAPVLKKKGFRRHARRLERAGEVVVENYSDAPSILAELEPFFEQHRRRWSDTEWPSLFEDSRDRAFYRELARSLGEDRVRFTVLRMGGEAVAYHFGFISKNDLIWYKPSYETRLSEHSPGQRLLWELVALLGSENLEGLDFTRGDEAFKSRLATETNWNLSCVWFPNRVARLGHLADERARAAFRKVRSAVRR